MSHRSGLVLIHVEQVSSIIILQSLARPFISSLRRAFFLDPIERLASASIHTHLSASSLLHLMSAPSRPFTLRVRLPSRPNNIVNTKIYLHTLARNNPSSHCSFSHNTLVLSPIEIMCGGILCVLFCEAGIKLRVVTSLAIIGFHGYSCSYRCRCFRRCGFITSEGAWEIRSCFLTFSGFTFQSRENEQHSTESEEWNRASLYLSARNCSIREDEEETGTEVLGFLIAVPDAGAGFSSFRLRFKSSTDFEIQWRGSCFWMRRRSRSSLESRRCNGLIRRG